MQWCFKCGVSSDKAELYDAISDRGIVKICEKCSFHEHIPLLKKPAKKQFIPAKPILPKDISVRMGRDSKSMYDRLSRLSGVQMSDKKPEDIEIVKQNRVLGDVANRNFREKIAREKGDTSDLIEDFHWVLMRIRRNRHISTNQLAEAIGEPEAAIRMAEKGVLPKNAVPFIRKIEDYLKIRLLKEGVAQQTPKAGSFNVSDSRSLRISDIRNIKPEERNPMPEENEIEEFEEVEEIEDDNSDVDVTDILFKK